MAGQGELYIYLYLFLYLPDGEGQPPKHVAVDWYHVCVFVYASCWFYKKNELLNPFMCQHAVMQKTIVTTSFYY